MYTIPQRLNNVPASRETRQFFYNDVCRAVEKAVAAEERLLSVKYGPNLLNAPLGFT